MIGPGQRVVGARGSYTIEHEYGRGGFGVTYLGRQEGEDRPVIVKVLRVDRLADWKALELFQREAAVLRGLSHPSIPEHIDDFSVGSENAPAGFVLVQELVPGKSLARLMEEGERLDEAQALGCFSELLRVLEYLHRLSPPVIHRDVTPKNVIARPDGRVALVDFGSVQHALRSAHSVSSTAAGTFGYAPPEQFVGRASPGSDLYGAAVTFLALATGLQPEHMPMDGARIDVPVLYKGDRRLVQLLQAMTDPDPRRRLGDATIALQRLSAMRGREPTADDFEAGSPSAAPPASEARVGDVDAYVALLKARLRDEGFSVLPGGTLGDVRVRLVARRAGASLRSAASIHAYVARDHDLRAAAHADTDAPRSALELFARAAHRAHAQQGGAFRSFVHGSTVVLPIFVTESSIAPNAIDGMRAIESRGKTVVPIAVSLADGAVHVAAVSARADRQVHAYLPYLWWLAAPRLQERPRIRPSSPVRRIAAAIALGAALMFGVAALYGRSEALTAFNALNLAVDPARNVLVVKTYTWGKQPELMVRTLTLSASGQRLPSRTLPADAFLCGSSNGKVVYLTGYEKFWRADLAGGEPEALFAATGAANCHTLGDRIVFDRGKPSQVFIREPSKSPLRVVGSELGDSLPAWFPSGTRLAVTAGAADQRAIVVIDLGDGQRRTVTRPAAAGRSREDVYPSVSPDETRLLFVRFGRLALGDQAMFNRATSRVGDLHMVDLATQEERLLVQDTCGVGSKGWLSNTEIALTKWTGEAEGCGPYVYDLTTGDMRKLADYEPF